MNPIGTLIFDTFRLILAVNDDICNVREVSQDSQPEPCPDDFEMLYINVAGGDRSDCGYWLECRI